MRNFLLLFPVLCLLVYASYALYLDYQKKPSFNSGSEQKLLGTIAESSNTVKRKSPQSPFWYNLNKNESLFDKDLIRTGVDSYAKIQLKDQGFIEIDQNTLISLEQNQDQSYSIDFRIGEFSAKDNQSKLSVKVNDATFMANKADFNIRISKEDGTQLEVQSGKIEVRDKDNKVIAVDKKSQISIDSKGKVEAMKTVVLLSSPEHLARIKSPAKEIRYPFTWAVLNNNIKQEVFEISSEQSFITNKTFKRTAHQSVEAPVKRGINYWRVGWLQKNKNSKASYRYTKARKFFLDIDESVKLLNPSDESQLDFLPNKQSLLLEWSTKQDANDFLIEISKSPDFKNIYKTFKSKKMSYLINNLESGGYFWRVHALDKNNNNLGLSATYSFAIRNIVPKLPNLKEPVANTKWTLDEDIIFRWESVKNADHYFLEIARDREFKQILKQTKLQDNNWQWQWQNEGTYYWRVKVRNANNLIIAQSITEKFQIDPAIKKDSIVIIKPENQKLILREKKEDISPVNFEWKSPFVLKPKYRFILSNNADLSEPIINKIVNFTQNLETLDKNGTYFWKVEWLNDNNEVIYYSPSQVFQYQFSTSLSASELQLPVDKSIFYTSDTMAIDFSWSKVEGAKSYLLVLETFDKEAKQTEVIKNLNINNNSTRIEKLSPAHYLWSVQALDEEGFEGTKSAIFRFIIKKSDSLEAPQLRPAIVK